MLPNCQCCGVRTVDLSFPYGWIMMHLCQPCFDQLKASTEAMLVVAETRLSTVEKRVAQLEVDYLNKQFAAPSARKDR